MLSLLITSDAKYILPIMATPTQQRSLLLKILKPTPDLDAESLFEHEFGALNMAALLRKEERAGLLCNLGPCCKALCFRRDSAIRKQLVKNEKGTTKQTYTNHPVVDNELLRLSLRLFKRKTVQQGSGPDKTEDTKLSQPYVPEMCLS